MKGIKNKVFIVTGGSKVLGKDITKTVVKAGAKVVANYRSED